MKIALATRKTLIAALVVPMLAVTAVSVQSFAGMSEAHAQTAPGGPNGGGNRGGNSGGSKSDTSSRGGLLDAAAPSNCPPGTVTHACPPPPPRRLPPRVSSISECSCHVTYRMVGGQRVAIKDCYVTLPGDKVAYCARNTQ
ncbi:hypothetical protein [Oricola nitratireducens]|uniref:hypothetical protein n=1 Tax=Oricola nitratireducens TaxID=2775868 RepID=UPI0018677CCC|nr:hypothetical protein [Oricola nitratireducens]